MSTAVHTTAAAARAVRRFVTVLAMCAVPGLAGADPVMEWNDIARQLIVVPTQSPVQQTRLMAIVHVAMHDAVSGITGEYEQYVAARSGRKRRHCPPNASPEGAAIAAAFHALKGLFGPSDFLDAKYAASLAGHGIAVTDPGIAVGQAAAAGILALRQHDGAAVAA